MVGVIAVGLFAAQQQSWANEEETSSGLLLEGAKGLFSSVGNGFEQLCVHSSKTAREQPRAKRPFPFVPASALLVVKCCGTGEAQILKKPTAARTGLPRASSSTQVNTTAIQPNNGQMM